MKVRHTLGLGFMILVAVTHLVSRSGLLLYVLLYVVTAKKPSYSGFIHLFGT